MKLSFPHTDLLIEHLAQGTKVSSILFDHFWIFCFLHLCLQTVETAPKLDSGKKAFVSVFTVLLRGVRVVGGVTICIYIYIWAGVYQLCPPSISALLRQGNITTPAFRHS